MQQAAYACVTACARHDKGMIAVCGMQKSFAMAGIHPRGDTSAWTDTPQEKLLRLQRGYEAAALTAPQPGGESAMTTSRKF